MVRAVTFDAAGTLIAVAEPVGETYARIAARHGVRADVEAVERRFREAMAAVPPLAFPAAAPEQVRECERRWWYDIVRRALGMTELDGGLDATFAALFAHYADARAWRVFPEVPEVLATLRARGLRLAVVSNFDARLCALLDQLGVATLFDTIVHSTLVGSAKPDPSIFRTAMARLAVDPSQGLHVGDDLAVDVEGARRAGLRAVLVDRQGRRANTPTGVPVLPSLETLPRVLADA